MTTSPAAPDRALVCTLLYTLANCDPAANPYRTLLVLWLAALARTQRQAGGPAPFDVLLLLDERTHDSVGTSLSVGAALRACADVGIRITTARLPVPPGHHEGMFYKYAVGAYDGLCQVARGYKALLYLDLDVLVVRPLAPLLAGVGAPGTLYVMPEGALEHENYSGELLRGDRGGVPAGAFGFSAGMWACVPSPAMLETLCRVLALQEATRGTYCVDQPAMNVTAWRGVASGALRLDAALFPRRAAVNQLVQNVNELPPDTCVTNFMGEPGNGQVHLDKVLAQHVALSG